MKKSYFISDSHNFFRTEERRMKATQKRSFEAFLSRLQAGSHLDRVARTTLRRDRAFAPIDSVQRKLHNVLIRSLFVSLGMSAIGFGFTSLPALAATAIPGDNAFTVTAICPSTADQVATLTQGESLNQSIGFNSTTGGLINIFDDQGNPIISPLFSSGTFAGTKDFTITNNSYPLERIYACVTNPGDVAVISSQTCPNFFNILTPTPISNNSCFGFGGQGVNVNVSNTSSSDNSSTSTSSSSNMSDPTNTNSATMPNTLSSTNTNTPTSNNTNTPSDSITNTSNPTNTINTTNNNMQTNNNKVIPTSTNTTRRLTPARTHRQLPMHQQTATPARSAQRTLTLVQ